MEVGCPILLFFVIAPGVSRLKTHPICEPWASCRLTVWLKYCSVVLWEFANMARPTAAKKENDTRWKSQTRHISVVSQSYVIGTHV